MINGGVIKFYKRYVDDTLVSIKPSDISSVLAKFNSFDRNLNFTVDTFPDGLIHFLDIKVLVDGTDIYRKETHTGQYTHFSSFETFPRKTAWVKSLFHRAFICSNKTYFNIWNGYPIRIRNFLIRKLKTKYENYSSFTINADSQTDENIAKIWIKIPYLGNRGENIIK